jgi:hypothetical protein
VVANGIRYYGICIKGGGTYQQFLGPIVCKLELSMSATLVVPPIVQVIHLKHDNYIPCMFLMPAMCGGGRSNGPRGIRGRLGCGIELVSAKDTNI